MMQRLVIVGTGGHGREVLDVVEAINHHCPTFELLGFVDDRQDNQLLIAQRGSEVLGPVETLADLNALYIIGIGSGEVRRNLDQRLSRWGCRAGTLVHPEATVGSSVELGEGVVVAAGARITTNVVLGRHTQLNVNSSVSHDCRLAPYVTVSPGVTVSGKVTIAEGTLLGVGCTLIQGLTIGEWVTVGAGAVVVGDLPDGVTAVGVPARYSPESA